jgi:RNA polymerase sigma factor (TIGR02999 family)
MRDILVEQARRKAAAKHGGRLSREELEEIPAFDEPPMDLLALDAAVKRLEARDPDKARIVMLRFFAGLTAAETAAAVGVSERTIEREWRYIKAWLRRELADGGATHG